MIYIGNAFSLQMACPPFIAMVRKVDAEDIRAAIKGKEYTSIIGHADTANVVSNMIGVELCCNRASVKVKDDDTLFVAQIVGGRLPEGATEIPAGTRLELYRVTISGG